MRNACPNIRAAWLKRSCRLLLGAALLWVPAGCGAINPDLLTTTGVSNPISSLTAPEGYVLISLINKTPSTVMVRVNITKENGSTKEWALSASAANIYLFEQECDVSQISINSYTYSLSGVAVEEPANLGTIIMNQNIYCGEVLSLTLEGTPPNVDFKAEVF